MDSIRISLCVSSSNVYITPQMFANDSKSTSIIIQLLWPCTARESSQESDGQTGSWCLDKGMLARDTRYQKNACPENQPIPHPKHTLAGLWGMGATLGDAKL